MKGIIFLSYYIVCLTVLVYGFSDEEYENSGGLAQTITVDISGAGNYKTVQSAIDSIPANNQKWIHIFIKRGIYKEQITIPKNKGYIYMQGEGIEKTIIAYDAHQTTSTSATFTAYPDYIIISGITFKNIYNVPLLTSQSTPVVQAVAAKMLGDRYLVTDSSFDGLQDTLYDSSGRHYYKRCHISGGVDFIFGSAQSIFERCVLNVTVGIYAPEKHWGIITAHKRESPKENGGFVFKFCTVCSAVKGKGKALLGRAWGRYARVIFYRSMLCDNILPIGWEAWSAEGHESDTTFVEYGCVGDGANTSQRVPWLKKPSLNDVYKFVDVSFIDQDGWLNSLPIQA